jgi:3-hydroxyisobutyrate dehydrogenase-like beta-hydroxyacid dehydrogenase
VLRQVMQAGVADSSILRLWDDLGPRWKKMLEPTASGTPLPNMRKDLHSALEFAQELGISLYIGSQASLIADAGVATGHDDPSL